MPDTELQQRIKYLVEHGGMWDDPVEDIRRTVRLVAVLSVIGLVLALIHALR